MGFTKTLVNIPTDLYAVDASGAWVARSLEDQGIKQLFEIDFYVSSSVQAMQPTYGFNTFAEVMARLKAENVRLGQTDFNINLEKSAENTAAINDQFDSPLLTNAQLTQIASDYDPVRLGAIIAHVRLIRRMFMRGLITYSELLEIVAYLASKDKIKRNAVERIAEAELTAGRLTTTQASLLISAYDNSIGVKLNLPKR